MSKLTKAEQKSATQTRRFQRGQKYRVRPLDIRSLIMELSVNGVKTA